jgi:hypothetical protein
LKYGEKIKEEVEGEKVFLPQRELRKEMSKLLQSDVDKMVEEELLKSMKIIKKGDLNYKNLSEYNRQYVTFIYSLGLLKSKYNTSYEKDKKAGILDIYLYDELSKIEISEDYKYIYKGEKL